MPNWCNNSITISGNKEQIDAFEKFLEEKEGNDWFDFFLPCPEDLMNSPSPPSEENKITFLEKYGAEDWYSWCVTNWGTKWNCTANDWDREGDSITFNFESAWSPPITLYEAIKDEYVIDATYCEEGMCFVGQFVDGEDNYYEYSDSESLDFIPEHLVEDYCLREMLEEMENFDSEEENSDDNWPSTDSDDENDEKEKNNE